MTWRDKAKPIIAAVIAQHQGEDITIVRRALREAYPFGPREYHPYRIWCDEVRAQLGLKRHKLRTVKTLLPYEDPNQQELFSNGQV